MKKLISVFGILALCTYMFCATITTAMAAETVQLDLSQGSIKLERTAEGAQYTQNGTTEPVGDANFVIRQSDTSKPTRNTITVSGGEVNVILTGVNISVGANSPISVKSGACLALNLVGENTLAATGDYYAGIDARWAELSIKGTGTLAVTGGEYGAGIEIGTITITSGTVTATGGAQGAGIGGGAGDSGGTITITGGTVTATGGLEGAGIGGGGYLYYGSGAVGSSSGGIVTISGGKVTAKGGNEGAGIGGGRNGDGGNIIISGGVVTAKGGNYGAGIGGGNSGDGGTVTITGGTVDATGGIQGAGIGGGRHGNGSSITISDSCVLATGGDSAAGIGGGCGGTAYDTEGGAGGTVTIRDAELTAKGDYYAIGGGVLDNQYGCDSITISNTTLALSYKDDNGADCQEHIFDLELPAEVTVPSDSQLTIQTVARSASGLTAWQWQSSANNRTWTDVAGQTSATLSIPVTSELDKLYFRCVVTNYYGNVVYTESAQVFVLAFAKQPTPVEVNVGDYAALEAKSTYANVTYHWERSYDEGVSWNVVPGEIYSSLLVDATLSESGALYRCVITATNGDQLASDAVPITVNTDDVTYRVKYYHQLPDGSGYGVAEQAVLVGTPNGSVTAPTKTFEGFEENTVKGVLSGTVTSDGSLVLSRYYDRKNYSISFDMMGGGALPTLTARYGAEVAAPAAPVRYGYDFGGWYADKELTTPYTFATMPLNGATVYAKWVNMDEGRGIEYQINSILFRDADNYEVLDSIPARDFLVEVSVTNLSSTHMDTVLFVSYNKDGRMLGFHYAFANPAIGQTMTFGTAIHNEDGQVTSVKVMVLSNLAGAQPLAKAMEEK